MAASPTISILGWTGDPLNRLLRFRGRITGQPEPITGYTFTAKFYPAKNGRRVPGSAVALDAGAYLTITDAAAGEAELAVPAAAMAALTPGDWFLIVQADPGDGDPEVVLTAIYSQREAA